MDGKGPREECACAANFRLLMCRCLCALHANTYRMFLFAHLAAVPLTNVFFGLPLIDAALHLFRLRNVVLREPSTRSSIAKSQATLSLEGTCPKKQCRPPLPSRCRLADLPKRFSKLKVSDESNLSVELVMGDGTNESEGTHAARGRACQIQQILTKRTDSRVF